MNSNTLDRLNRKELVMSGSEIANRLTAFGGEEGVNESYRSKYYWEH